MTRVVPDPRLLKAHEHARTGDALRAEMLYLAVLRDQPQNTDAARAVSLLATQRGDLDRALEYLNLALRAMPADPTLRLELAQLLWQREQPEAAAGVLLALVAEQPGQPMAWLLLGQIREALGDMLGAMKAWYQAVTLAQKTGHWMDRNSTDPAIVELVMGNIEKLRLGRREHLLNAFGALRAEHGASAVARVDRALFGFLGEVDATPPDPRQRPKFLYFPGLVDAPYHDPMLQPWAPRLQAAWAELRDEASALLGNQQNFESFLGLKPGERKDDYISGSAPNPAWDAFFFFRHSERFDANHALCPKTSALLESIELCRVDHQAPEVCFSVLRPGSKIMAHHGVTNTRLVMHLPLIVPPGCALNVVGAGEHRWREGELMMFDDTYQHEAWNDSDSTRVILLMDCWNPHLTAVEKIAVKQLVEAIDAFERT